MCVMSAPRATCPIPRASVWMRTAVVLGQTRALPTPRARTFPRPRLTQKQPVSVLVGWWVTVLWRARDAEVSILSHVLLLHVQVFVLMMIASFLSADFDGCKDAPCVASSTCTDVPAPGTGVNCNCNSPLVGDGKVGGTGCSCPPGSKKASPGPCGNNIIGNRLLYLCSHVCVPLTDVLSLSICRAFHM